MDTGKAGNQSCEAFISAQLLTIIRPRNIILHAINTANVWRRDLEPVCFLRSVAPLAILLRAEDGTSARRGTRAGSSGLLSIAVQAKKITL